MRTPPPRGVRHGSKGNFWVVCDSALLGPARVFAKTGPHPSDCGVPNDVSRNRTSSLVWVAGLALCAGAAFVGHSLRPPSEPSSKAGDLRPVLEQMAQGQSELRAAIEALTARLEPRESVQLAAPRLAERISERTGFAPDLAALIESMDALRASLNELASPIQAGKQASLPSIGGRLRDARQRHPEIQWGTLDSLDEAWRNDSHAADRSQHFQTAKDLLVEYGPPSAIYRPKDGLLFVYRHHPEGAAGRAWYFRLQDGFVVEFWIEDEELEAD